MADVLVDDAPRRTRRLGVAGGGLLLALVVGGAALRGTLPPPPLELRVAALSGTALQGESFIRLHVTLEQSGADGLDEVVLTVAGTTQRGQHPTRFEGERTTVQVDITPVCASLREETAAGVLDLRLRDATGADRRVRLALPADARLERLLRYRCA